MAHSDLQSSHTRFALRDVRETTQAKAYKCRLVAPEEPGLYCLADMTRFAPLAPANHASIAEAMAKFKAGSEFIITKVQLDSEVKQQYQNPTLGPAPGPSNSLKTLSRRFQTPPLPRPSAKRQLGESRSTF